MRLMRTAILVGLVLMLPRAAQAADGELTWKYDGHSKLPDAAAEAKRSGKRLLIGLAGSPT